LAAPPLYSRRLVGSWLHAKGTLDLLARNERIECVRLSSLFS
jgi:hypothetical protein